MDIQRKCFEESNNVNPDWSFKFNEELQQYIALDSEMELQVDEFNELWDAFRAGWQAAKAQAVLEVKPSRHVTLTCAQLREAFMFGAPNKDDQEQLETEMTIQWSDEGHSGAGYYCYYADYPEEGAIKLGEAQEPTNESE